MKIPSLILRQLYTFGSLRNGAEGVQFSLKNRLSDATLSGLRELSIDHHTVPMERVSLQVAPGQVVGAPQINRESPLAFPLGKIVTIHAGGRTLDKGKHRLSLRFETQPFGELALEVKDAVSSGEVERRKVPVDKDDDYGEEIIKRRQEFVRSFSGVDFRHVARYSFEPRLAQGNVECFTGVAQVPIGVAGPLLVNGEYARGEFLVPLATTEGTLVASYNRGIKLLNMAGGVKATVQDDMMQRAPVFVFDSAREAIAFRKWVDENMDGIRKAAEETSTVAKLLYIDTFLSNKFAFLRFNYATGDAAGQNMVGRATFAACGWILDRAPTVKKFFLESNLATDKKASHVNVMRTRGKRVTAEAVVPRDLLVEQMRVEPESLHFHWGVGTIGAVLSGANNNGCHSPNAVTAIFIATGQDVANVSESSAAILYTELTAAGDLYMSITMPSLIVATYGGGTGLPTQRECLEIMGCYGKGKVRKFAEIVAGAVLAGELSLASAISSLDWVSSHETYGRNR
jgi:hydroxymethylglutaryl-CoA reductase (NADPH)